MNKSHLPVIYTREYHTVIQPVLSELSRVRSSMTAGAWLTFVYQKQEGIILNPTSHLGAELATRSEMATTIDNIFHQFLKGELLLVTR